MYQYEDHVDISPEQLLQKVTQEQIFEFILGLPFSFTDRYISPLRIDTKPGCRFEQREDGTILFVDFGDPFKTHRTCFAMVMEKHEVTLTRAINMIVQYYKLSGDKMDYEPTPDHPLPLYLEAPTNNTKITYTKAMYSRRDKKFWNQFCISEDDLLEDKVFVTSRVTIHKRGGKPFTFRPATPCYVIDFIDAVKIYQPYSTKYKWITNCDSEHVGNFDNLPPEGREVMIASGYKDHRVLRNMLGASSKIGRERTGVVWFQNEGCIPAMYILESLAKRFDVITIFYDSDLAGVRAARKLQKVFNAIRSNCCRMVFIPRSQVIYNRYGYYLKDPGMYVHKEGRQEFSKILNQIL